MIALLTACSSFRQPAGSAQHPHDHVHANVHVTDQLPDASLAELSQASDLVVFGQVVAAVDGVRIGTDTNAGHTVLTLAVDETLKGNAGTKTVEVAMLTHVHGVALVIEDRPTPRVGDRGIWMLRPIAPEFEREGFVLTNQRSQILASEDGDLSAVLAHLRATA